MNRDRSEVLDELLVLRCQDGEPEALEALARRWHPRFLQHTLRLTGDREAARDLAQEVWMAIARGIHRLEDPARFRGWAYRIAVHKSRDWVRREQGKRRVLRRAAASEEPEPSQGGSEATQRLLATLRGLSPEQRTILSWYYLEEMSVREIAGVLSIPEGTVKSRLFYARKALRECLEEGS